MTARKRSRSSDDDPDADQCLPISKRIHRLQLGAQSREECTSSPHEQSTLNAIGVQQHQSGSNSNASGANGPQGCPMPSCSGNQEVVANSGPHAHPQPSQDHQQQETYPKYEPVLPAMDNPHYYHINSVLFKANCDRLQRQNNQTFPT